MMGFSLSSVITNGADSSILKNPIQDHVSSLGTITSGVGTITKNLPDVQSAMASLSSMQAKASSFVAEEMQSLKTKLPIMAAVSRVEGLGSALMGKATGTSATPLLAASTAGITGIGPMMSNVMDTISGSFQSIGALLPHVAGATPEEKLKNFSATVPDKKIPDPADPTGKTLIDNPAYTAFAAQNADTLAGLTAASASVSATTSGTMAHIDTVKASDSAATSAGVSKLKDYAFASFCSQAHPPAVRNILDKFTARPTAETFVDKQIARTASSSQNQVIESTGNQKYVVIQTAKQTSEGPTTQQSFPEAGAKKLTDQQLDDYKQVLLAQSETLFAWKERVDAKWKTLGEWKSARNYDAIKADAQNNPDDATKQSAYKSLKDQIVASDEYKDYDADSKLYNQALARQRSDIERYNRAREGLDATALVPSSKTFGITEMAVLK